MGKIEEIVSKLNSIKEERLISLMDLASQIGVSIKTLKKVAAAKDTNSIRFLTLRKIDEYIKKFEQSEKENNG